MQKFKIGDKVRVIHIDEQDNSIYGSMMLGLEGEISGFTYSIDYPYKLNIGDPNWRFKENELILVSQKIVSANKQTMASKIKNIAKSLLDSDLKAMISVGWLNGDLSLTEEGKDVVLARYFSKNKEVFGEMATELLKEQEKDCK